ncbi:transcription antitermination factor NusB [[Mycoplasma] anseris]|uniref:Transcription antitermination protein NusB n=1 Tax=[Mycoplasma] anseris TaxID=92400 RepID=A0A2Z4NDL6_9BACT|nr:transcription antitermination factor NusB [[Mycoplasma] anseris]AWX69683.1 transcription antitermination protein NusB [[Mycoplasma] anseris]
MYNEIDQEKPNSKLSTEDEKIIFLLKKYEKRTKLINIIYSYELFDQKIEINEIFENQDLNADEIFALENISKNYDNFKNIIIKTLSNEWTYERVLPYVRSVLIYGLFELMFNKPKVVINELINITKIFVPGNHYKFVNKVLDILAQVVNKKNA